MLVQDLRNMAIAELDDDNEPALGMVLLLDGLDEASSRLVGGSFTNPRSCLVAHSHCGVR